MDNFGPGAFALIPMLVMLAFYVFVIYVLVSFLRFMQNKNKHDMERNQKLDRLIDLFQQRALEKKNGGTAQHTESENDDK